MNPDTEIERELDAAFSELREEIRKSVPPYAEMRRAALVLSPGGTGHRAMRWAAVAAGIAALGIVVAFVAGKRGETDSLASEIAMAEEIAAWTAPTDSLYALSSFEIPATVPRLTLGADYVPDIFPGGVETSRDESEVER